jgi:hypothetical protein
MGSLGSWGLASFVLLAAACAAACSKPSFSLTQAELMDPQSCQTCHPDAFSQWSGSMHAYAADDPVFVAMNTRAQREAKLGTFCVKCHAPVAVATGATDGTNVDSLPQHLKGVTCYFCHSAQTVTDIHDNPITLATDGVLRAGIQNPTPNTAHDAGYLALLDRYDDSSATLCGSCHDIVNGHGVQLERTFSEWKGTVFSKPPAELTCSNCHMNGSKGVAAQVTGVGIREVHAHDFPAVDVPLTTFPNASDLQTAVQASLDSTLQAALCVKGIPGQVNIQVVLDNVAAGHQWPSGASQDRRAWIEVQAFSNGMATPYFTSGVVADGQSVLDLKDPNLWLIRDCIFDGMGNEAHMFWDAVSHDSNQLPGPVTLDKLDPAFYMTHAYRDYPAPTSTPPMLTTMPDRVTMRVRLVPVGLDVLDDLVQSGDLDAGVKTAMPTFDLAGGTLEWTVAKATIKYPDPQQHVPVACVSSGLTQGGANANPAPPHMKCSP